MGELSDKYSYALKVLCKRVYGHEDLSKAYFYAPYIDLQLSRPIYDSTEPLVGVQRKQSEVDVPLTNEDR